ncbi:MAG: aldo/keto reductase [Actinobacteria bacterium]|nr:aldo/keto reductase [Actinomycetota bacterium]
MEIPTKKLKNGFEIPVFGIGTSGIGEDSNRDPNNDDQTDINSIRAALDMGITHIDTAEIYSHGHSEELIGQAIKEYNREKLFICSKVYHTNLHYNDLIRSAKNSLKRLVTNYLDLYLIHLPNKDVPFKRTMSAMDSLIDNGLVKYIGVSNFNVQQVKEVQSYSKNKIVVDQVQYNLIYREPERVGILEYCQKNDVILSAWAPIQKGILTNEGVKILDDMCDKYDKTPAQIAINWLISQDNVITLVRCRNIDHLKENLGAIGWTIQFSDIEKFRSDFPCQKETGEIYMGT